MKSRAAPALKKFKIFIHKKKKTCTVHWNPGYKLRIQFGPYSTKKKYVAYQITRNKSLIWLFWDKALIFMVEPYGIYRYCYFWVILGASTTENEFLNCKIWLQ